MDKAEARGRRAYTVGAAVLATLALALGALAGDGVEPAQAGKGGGWVKYKGKTDADEKVSFKRKGKKIKKVKAKQVYYTCQGVLRYYVFTPKGKAKIKKGGKFEISEQVGKPDTGFEITMFGEVHGKSAEGDFEVVLADYYTCASDNPWEAKAKK